MKKFVVTGASTYGVKNMGDDAMLATMVQGLKAAHPGCDISFLARHPDADYDRVFGFKSLKNLDHDTREAAAGRIFWGMNPGDPDDHLKAMARAIAEADLLIIGGNSFMELFPNGFLKGISSYAATLATFAKFVGTPIALFGANVVDDITQETTQAHARFLAGNAIAVTMREESGKNYLTDLGIGDRNMHVLGDPAFGFDCPKQDARAILAREGIELEEGRPVIGVGFRYEYWKGGDEEFLAIGRQVSALLDELVESLCAQVLFVPNCTYTQSNKWQDDRVVHAGMMADMKHRAHARSVSQDLSVFETFALFSLLDMHVSNRRHSCIFAAMNQVPFAALAGSLQGHMPPFAADLGVPGQVAAMTDWPAVRALAHKTWTDRDTLKAAMAPRVAHLRETARQHIPTILGALA
ncbi:MAG: polysaccharide pyruvyl transferase family protein [Alphaproteobacteria bacterium]|nr:MAG: polysaccharide pyruvyl transferase family protein [Alphaproteobacteria bacterium]